MLTKTAAIIFNKTEIAMFYQLFPSNDENLLVLSHLKTHFEFNSQNWMT